MFVNGMNTPMNFVLDTNNAANITPLYRQSQVCIYVKVRTHLNDKIKQIITSGFKSSVRLTHVVRYIKFPRHQIRTTLGG